MSDKMFDRVAAVKELAIAISSGFVESPLREKYSTAPPVQPLKKYHRHVEVTLNINCGCGEKFDSITNARTHSHNSGHTLTIGGDVRRKQVEVA